MSFCVFYVFFLHPPQSGVLQDKTWQEFALCIQVKGPTKSYLYLLKLITFMLWKTVTETQLQMLTILFRLQVIFWKNWWHVDNY